MLARVRAKAGRVATAAGFVVLTTGLVTDQVTAPGLAAAAATAVVGLAANGTIRRAPSTVRATAIAVYAAPHAGCMAILVGERLAPAGGTSSLIQLGAAVLWSSATLLIRPGRLARAVVDEAIAQQLAEAAEEEVVEPAEVEAAPEYASRAAQWWAEEIAVEDGIAPGTVLLEHQQVSENCVAVIIGAAQRGRPVPDISKARLSAHLDMPEDLIGIEPVPGRGAGVRLLIVGERPQPAELETNLGGDEELWAEIAATAMPGVQLLESNTYTMRKELT